MAALAKLAQEVWQQRACPEQRPPDPTHELVAVDLRRVAAQHAGERGQRRSLDDEALDDGEDLSEARRLVRDMRAGGQTRPLAARKLQFLDKNGASTIPRRTAAPAVTPERTQCGSDNGADQPEPSRVLLDG